MDATRIESEKPAGLYVSRAEMRRLLDVVEDARDALSQTELTPDPGLAGRLGAHLDWLRTRLGK